MGGSLSPFWPLSTSIVIVVQTPRFHLNSFRQAPPGLATPNPSPFRPASHCWRGSSLRCKSWPCHCHPECTTYKKNEIRPSSRTRSSLGTRARLPLGFMFTLPALASLQPLAFTRHHVIAHALTWEWRVLCQFILLQQRGRSLLCARYCAKHFVYIISRGRYNYQPPLNR